MAQGQRLTDEQIETIRLTYAETGSGRQAARAAGCSEAAARKYCKSPDDDFTQLRAQKQADIITKLAEARAVYIQHLVHKSVVTPTNAKDAAVIVGILTDKHQLLTGAATERKEITIREKASRLAKELDIPVEDVLAEIEAVASGSWDSWAPQ